MKIHSNNSTLKITNKQRQNKVATELICCSSSNFLDWFDAALQFSVSRIKYFISACYCTLYTRTFEYFTVILAFLRNFYTMYCFLKPYLPSSFCLET